MSFIPATTVRSALNHRRLSAAIRRQHEYDSPRAARKGLSGYFEFYNQERLHQSLGYRTPAEVYFDTTLQRQEK